MTGLVALNELLDMELLIIPTNRVKKGEDYEIIRKELKALEVVITHKLLNYVLKNPKCAKMYNLSDTDIQTLKEVFHD